MTFAEKCGLILFVMSDNIKSFGGALLRQAQMREWKAIPEAERPTWEQFKRGLKRKKKWDLLLTFPEILIFCFLLWGYMINTSLRITALRLSLVVVLSAGLRLATLALRPRSLSLVTPSRASSAKSPRATCPIHHTTGNSYGKIRNSQYAFRAGINHAKSPRQGGVFYFLFF